MEENELNTRDYWQKQMLHIIEISHPYLLCDKGTAEEIVNARSSMAHEEYLCLINTGAPDFYAMELAREVLLSGYKWSPTDFLESLYWLEFRKTLDKNERIIFYFMYKDIFDKYSGIDLDENVDKELELEIEILERMRMGTFMYN